jgi:hypothetical protein
MKVTNMVIDDEKYVFESSGKNVSVSTTKEFKSKLFKVEDFNQSLTESIEYSKIFSVNPANADYDITATLTHWFQPPMGLEFHTDLRVRYIIKQQDKVLFDKELESNSVAYFKDAFAGPKRSIISFERAVKQNIEMFINEISPMEF